MTVQIVIFSSGTTPLIDLEDDLLRAEGLSWSRGYPGAFAGLECRFFIPRPFREWNIAHGKRIAIFDGLDMVFEGVVDSIDPDLSGGRSGLTINSVGFWAHALMRRTWTKYWADTRISEDAWAEDGTVGATGPELAFIARRKDGGDATIRFTPKNEAWATNDSINAIYTAPSGTTIDRIEYDYDFDEQAQNWALEIRDITNASTAVSITTTGTATGQSHDFSPVSSQISLRLRAGANQTPTSNGDYYGEFSNITVYATFEASHTGTEGTFDINELAEDIALKFSSDISGDLDLIDANTLALAPFISDGETVADILKRAWDFGDSTNDRWAAGITFSSEATDDLAKLFVEQVPALTDYDYIVNFDSPNLAEPFRLDWITERMANYVVVKYTDELGDRKIVTPDDDATLTDSDSVSTYGAHHHVLRLPQTTQARAISLGVQYLNTHKDPVWTVTRPIQVVGFIYDKNNVPVDFTRIEPGKRIKVGEFIDDGSGTWLTFLISRCRYDVERQICALEIDRPRGLEVEIARLRKEAEREFA